MAPDGFPNGVQPHEVFAATCDDPTNSRLDVCHLIVALRGPDHECAFWARVGIGGNDLNRKFVGQAFGEVLQLVVHNLGSAESAV